MIVKKFSVENWNLKPNKTKKPDTLANRKILEHNINSYVKWVLDILEDIPKAENERYSVLGIYMNSYWVEYLNEHLYPMDWLGYSPCVNDNIPLDEVWIDEDKAIEKND